MPTRKMVMFDFGDKNTNEYKSYSFFVDDETNNPRNKNTLEKSRFPYHFVESPEPYAVFVKENLLNEGECAFLLMAIGEIREWGGVGIDFWKERTIGLFNVLDERHFFSSEIKKICLKIHDKIQNFICTSFSSDVYADQIVITRWPVGSWQMPHIDAVDGRERIAGSVVFLNDDYDGGRPFYPYYGTSISPKKGMIYAHDAGYSHLHGVTKIQKNPRYTISSTWTTNPTKSSYYELTERLRKSLETEV